MNGNGIVCIIPQEYHSIENHCSELSDYQFLIQ